jgi:hypothetical protein
MATVFAALLMEHRVVGSFADWMSDAFGEVDARLSHSFPLPRRRLIGMMYRYSLQAFMIYLGAALLVIPHRPLSMLYIGASVILFVIAGAFPLFVCFRDVWNEEGDDRFRVWIRLFAVCLVHEAVLLLISPFVLIATFLLEMVRVTFRFLSCGDEAKKLLIILGTLVAFAGLISQFVASFV